MCFYLSSMYVYIYIYINVYHVHRPEAPMPKDPKPEADPSVTTVGPRAAQSSAASARGAEERLAIVLVPREPLNLGVYLQSYWASPCDYRCISSL